MCSGECSSTHVFFFSTRKLTPDNASLRMVEPIRPRPNRHTPLGGRASVYLKAELDRYLPAPTCSNIQRARELASLAAGAPGAVPRMARGAAVGNRCPGLASRTAPFVQRRNTHQMRQLSPSRIRGRRGGWKILP